jgi:shikimate kinase
LQVADPIEKIRSLLAERKPVYKKADVMINSELRTLPQVVQQVVYHFKLVTNSDFSKQNKIGSQN